MRHKIRVQTEIQVGHRRPVREAILMMRSKWSGHAFADDIDHFGELVSHFGLAPALVQMSEGVEKG